MSLDYRKLLDKADEKFVSIETSGSNNYYYCVIAYIHETDKQQIILDLKHNPDIKKDLKKRFDLVCGMLASKDYPYDAPPGFSYKFDMKIDDEEYGGLIVKEITDDYAILCYDFPFQPRYRPSGKIRGKI